MWKELSTSWVLFVDCLGRVVWVCGEGFGEGASVSIQCEEEPWLCNAVRDHFISGRRESQRKAREELSAAWKNRSDLEVAISMCCSRSRAEIGSPSIVVVVVVVVVVTLV